MNGFISQVFWTADSKFAFQKVGNVWNLYGADGSFRKEFRSFMAMCLFIESEGMK